MYKALESFATNDYDVKRSQILEDDFTSQEEIQEFINIGYIIEYDSTLEITENGQYDVTDYETADVNVSGGGSESEYNVYVDTTKDLRSYTGFRSQVTKINIDTSEMTSLHSYCDYCVSLVDDVHFTDTSKVTNMQNIFSNCSSLVAAPTMDTSNVENFQNAFLNDNNLQSVPQYKFDSIYTMSSCFSGCRKLTNIPIFNISNLSHNQGVQNMFQSCDLFNSSDLNNVLATMLTLTSAYTGTRTLKYIGLSSTQATTCTTLSNWSALEAAGWSTGY